MFSTLNWLVESLKRGLRMTDNLFEELKPKGWIGNYTDILRRDLPEIAYKWALANAESVFSSCCFNQFTYTRVGRLHLGVWNMGIAPSGEWKSIPILNFSIPILDYIGERYDKRYPLMISRFSPESLIKHMTWHQIREYDPEKETTKKGKKKGEVITKMGGWDERMVIGNKGLIVRDEWTSMMKGMLSKTWLAGVSEILSEVFDHRVLPRFTMEHGKQDVPYCNFSFLSATTPYIYDLLETGYFAQGLGNRIDHNLFGDKAKIRKKEEEWYEYGRHHRMREEDISKLGNQLLGVMQSNVTYVGFTTEAQEEHSKFDYEIQKQRRALDPNDFKRSYLQRQSTKCLRRAVIYAMSRRAESIQKTADVLVQVDDMKLAVKRQKDLYDDFLKLLKDWRTYEKGSEHPPSTDIGDKERVLSVMSQIKFASKTLLAEKAGYNKDNIKFILTLKSLVAEGKLKDFDKDERKLLIAKMGDGKRKKLRIGNVRGIPPALYQYVEEGQ